MSSSSPVDHHLEESKPVISSASPSSSLESSVESLLTNSTSSSLVHISHSQLLPHEGLTDLLHSSSPDLSSSEGEGEIDSQDISKWDKVKKKKSLSQHEKKLPIIEQLTTPSPQQSSTHTTSNEFPAPDDDNKSAYEAAHRILSDGETSSTSIVHVAESAIQPVSHRGPSLSRLPSPSPYPPPHLPHQSPHLTFSQEELQSIPTHTLTSTSSFAISILPSTLEIERLVSAAEIAIEETKSLSQSTHQDIDIHMVSSQSSLLSSMNADNALAHSLLDSTTFGSHSDMMVPSSSSGLTASSEWPDTQSSHMNQSNDLVESIVHVNDSTPSQVTDLKDSWHEIEQDKIDSSPVKAEELSSSGANTSVLSCVSSSDSEPTDSKTAETDSVEVHASSVSAGSFFSKFLSSLKEMYASLVMLVSKQLSLSKLKEYYEMLIGYVQKNSSSLIIGSINFLVGMLCMKLWLHYKQSKSTNHSKEYVEYMEKFDPKVYQNSFPTVQSITNSYAYIPQSKTQPPSPSIPTNSSDLSSSTRHAQATASSTLTPVNSSSHPISPLLNPAQATPTSLRESVLQLLQQQAFNSPSIGLLYQLVHPDLDQHLRFSKLHQLLQHILRQINTVEDLYTIWA